MERNRLSSESSCKSWLSSMTIDSEDGYQTCVSEDSTKGAFSRQTSTDDECFLPKDGDDFLRRSSSRRNRSISTASSGSMSPLWEGNFSSMFGTLPRKAEGKRPEATLEIHPWSSSCCGRGRESFLTGYGALSNWITSQVSCSFSRRLHPSGGKVPMD